MDGGRYDTWLYQYKGVAKVTLYSGGDSGQYKVVTLAEGEAGVVPPHTSYSIERYDLTFPTWPIIARAVSPPTRAHPSRPITAARQPAHCVVSWRWRQRSQRQRQRHQSN